MGALHPPPAWLTWVAVMTRQACDSIMVSACSFCMVLGFCLLITLDITYSVLPFCMHVVLCAWSDNIPVFTL